MPCGSGHPGSRSGWGQCRAPLDSLDLEGVVLHDHVGQEFLAGLVDQCPGGIFVSGFECDFDAFADADVLYACDTYMIHIACYSLALRIEQFFMGHDIDFCFEFHGAKVKKGIRT